MIEKTYNVGIYCRLSNDDERDGESVSIENQKLLLQSYVRQRGWILQSSLITPSSDGVFQTRELPLRKGTPVIGLCFVTPTEIWIGS